MIVPSSIDAEKSLISSLIVDNEAFIKLDEIRILPEDFYADQHKKIFSAIMDLHERGEGITPLTLSNILKIRKQIHEVGGDSYITDLTSVEFSSANIVHHAKIVKEKSILRKVINAGTQIIQLAQSPAAENIETLIDETERIVFDVADNGVKQTFTPLREAVKTVLKNLQDLQAKKTSVHGVPSGFLDLDNITSGFKPGQFIVIAGRPGMGKTSFALNVCQNAAIRAKAPVAFFSLEMSKEELATKILNSEAKISSHRTKTGKLTNQDWAQIAEASSHLVNAPIFLDDSTPLTVFDMRARCRRLKAEHGLAMVVVDYLQLMSGSSKSQREGSREREIAEISRTLKSLAGELKIPIIGLSQLSRAVEARQDKRPMLQDLRESGAIEQDADMVMFVYRDEVYNADSPDKGTAEVILSKHRAGQCANIRVAWFPEWTSFQNLVSDSYMP